MMIKEEIIRMAREAGYSDAQDWSVLVRFAALVADAGREACAKVCESMRPSEQEFDQRFYTACTLNANAIRARGETSSRGQE